MKFRLLTVLIVFIVVFNKPLNAQDSTVSTIILLRHAEKQDDGTSDPSLSVTGRERAVRLKKMLEMVKVDHFFSTPYKRTRETLVPLAGNKQILDYDPRSQASFASYLSDQKGSVIVVAGHSNTIPVLANQLIGTNKYQPLEESQYDRIWVITIKGKDALSCHVLLY